MIACKRCQSVLIVKNGKGNLNTRHHLALMTRRTKVVSKQEEMVDASLKIWHHSKNKKFL